MKAAVAALGVALAVCLTMNVMLFQRLVVLESKFSKTARIEDRGSRNEEERGARSEDGRRTEEKRTGESRPEESPVPQPGKSGPTPAGTPDRVMTGGTAMEATPAMKALIASEVERTIKEKYGDLPRLTRMEDPIVVMERELGLTPNQKMQIAELWQKREDEMEKAIHDTKMSDMHEKMKEMEGRYDGLIKSHLDLGQQAKYDELKKGGKLMGGGVVFHMEVKSEKPPQKP